MKEQSILIIIEVLGEQLTELKQENEQLKIDLENVSIYAQEEVERKNGLLEETEKLREEIKSTPVTLLGSNGGEKVYTETELRERMSEQAKGYLERIKETEEEKMKILDARNSQAKMLREIRKIAGEESDLIGMQKILKVIEGE